MTNTANEQFLAAFEAAFANGQLLKCTLSRPSLAAPDGLKNVYIRTVELKKGLRLAFNYRYKNRDEAKNYPIEEALAQLAHLLDGPFSNAELLTPERDFSLLIDKNGEGRFSEKKPAQPNATPSPFSHDRSKKRLLDPTAPWLHALGIASAKGEILAASQDKWRQINKYLEIIESLHHERALPQALRIADMGSGKGYLTFALFDFLQNKLGLAPHITGIELRPALVGLCNDIAHKNGFQTLEFVAQDIAEYRPERLDMLIALHACDTATDLALATGLRSKAQIIVAAPCCHKQVRRDMRPPQALSPMLQHGILLERQAEILTDSIRSLLLESAGYRTKVFEFISSGHTAKNVMITATLDGRRKDQRRAEALEQIAALKQTFGLREHFLERLMMG
jgi:hypothetical protein